MPNLHQLNTLADKIKKDINSIDTNYKPIEILTENSKGTSISFNFYNWNFYFLLPMEKK